MIKYFIIILFFNTIPSFAYNYTFQREWEDIFYKDAYYKILNMLEEKDSLCFKLAVFYTENAFYKDSLDYTKFQKHLDSVVKKLNYLIDSKNISSYKTAKQYAIWSYMCEPSILNDSITMQYDFNDFMGYNDWSTQFVTKLIKTKKGNCHSLPFYFKILSEEIGCESFLVSAPSHLYIKHLSEAGEWVNIELTNGGFSSDAWIISSMAITAEGIRNGIYMRPLSLKESVAFCLYDLAMGYKEKYGFDKNALEMCEKSLEYYPKNVMAIMFKADAIKEEINAIKRQPNTNNLDRIWLKERILSHEVLVRQIELLGHREMTEKEYEQWAKDMEEEIKNQEDKSVNK